MQVLALHGIQAGGFGRNGLALNRGHARPAFRGF